jgi:hypothetical protein
MSYLTKILKGVTIFTCGIGSCAYLTKPSNDSFAIQVTRNENIVQRVLIIEALKYCVKYDDYIFFKKATVTFADDMSEHYGAFNNWYVYSGKNKNVE